MVPHQNLLSMWQHILTLLPQPSKVPLFVQPDVLCSTFQQFVTSTSTFSTFARLCIQVSVRILGGLMALGYEIGTIMKRNSIIHSDDRLTIKLDTIEGMGHGFVQVSHPLLIHKQTSQLLCCCPDSSARTVQFQPKHNC